MKVCISFVEGCIGEGWRIVDGLRDRGRESSDGQGAATEHNSHRGTTLTNSSHILIRYSKHLDKAQQAERANYSNSHDPRTSVRNVLMASLLPSGCWSLLVSVSFSLSLLPGAGLNAS